MSLTSLSGLYAQVASLVENRLWARVLAGLAAGLLVGALLGPNLGWVEPSLAKPLTAWLALPGDLFLRLVQMIMIPLVLASIVQGLAGETGRDSVATLGARVGVYFVLTTLLAIGLGTAAALLLRPGRGQALASTWDSPTQPLGRQESLDLPSVITGLLPSNPLASMLSGEMLSIVVFAIIVGAALGSMPRERAEPLLSWFASMQEICMTITRWAMKLAPLAVFGLIARAMTSSGAALITGLGLYVLTVLGTLLVLLALYGLTVWAVAGMRPRAFLGASRDVLLLAFSVASSAAAMPLSMKTAEEKLGVPTAISRFIIPIGAVMNMNGTAAYQAIATVFLAQSYGIELALPTLLLMVVTTAAASIGTPSAPGAGIVILATVLASAGIPAEGISLIIGVDYLLGMCRTSVNVAGDLTACMVFSRWQGRPSSPQPPAAPADEADTPTHTA